jgi:hypothetical protein
MIFIKAVTKIRQPVGLIFSHIFYSKVKLLDQGCMFSKIKY